MVESKREHPRKAALRRAHAVGVDKIARAIMSAQKSEAITLLPVDDAERAYCTAELGKGLCTEMFFRYLLADAELRGTEKALEALKLMRANCDEFEKRLRSVVSPPDPKLILPDEDDDDTEPPTETRVIARF